jgi:hypothetical protein
MIIKTRKVRWVGHKACVWNGRQAYIQYFDQKTSKEKIIWKTQVMKLVIKDEYNIL